MGSKCSDYEEIELRKSWYAVNEEKKDDSWNSLEADFCNYLQWTILL